MPSNKTQKAKRVLKDISFDADSAHLALCSKEQGVANQADYALVLKGADVSEEFLQKMQQVKVTMELPQFLERFFYLWEGDAKVLACMFGYVEPEESQAKEQDEANKEMQDWISHKMQAFEIVKSLEGQDTAELQKSLSAMTEGDLLALLQVQEQIEKALASSESINDLTKSNTNKEENMPVQETIAKSAYVALEKALEDQKTELTKALEDRQVELTKALETVAKYEALQKEAIAKSRKEALVAACGDKAEVLFKAVSEVEDQVFADVVKALSEMQASIDKSALFSEAGASVEEQVETESAVTKLIKAKYSK